MSEWTYAPATEIDSLSGRLAKEDVGRRNVEKCGCLRADPPLIRPGHRPSCRLLNPPPGHRAAYANDIAPAHVGELQHGDQGVQEFGMYRNNPAAAALALPDT